MWQLSSIFAWGQFHVSTIHLREANTRVKIMLAEAELQEDKVTWVGGRVHGRAVEVVGQLCVPLSPTPTENGTVMNKLSNLKDTFWAHAVEKQITKSFPVMAPSFRDDRLLATDHTQQQERMCEVQGCSVILEHAKDIRHHLDGHITSFLGTSLQWVACKWCVGQ